MGYGDATAWPVVDKSYDGGIDVIISEDKLEFGLIYIQANGYNRDVKVGRKKLQAYAGAVPTVNKGVFLSASKEFASLSEKHISLVDGNRLCEFMLMYGVGVQAIKTYILYNVDDKCFS